MSSKRLLAAAIHKKVYIYEIASASSTPVRIPDCLRMHVHESIFELKLTCLDAHTMNVTAVSFHSEGKWLVTGSEDGTIRIWDLRCVRCYISP